MRWEELRWGEKSSHDLRWDEVSSAKSASVKCEVQGVKSAMWSVRKVFAWHCIAPGSRAGHVLGQQHCSSFAKHARTGLAGARRMQVLEVVLGSDSWKLRWHMSRGEMRRDELGQGEKSSDEMKSAVWRVKCEVWSVKCEVRRKQWEVRSVKCGLWSVKCGVWSVKCGVLRMQCEVKRGMRRKQCEVWSVKCEVWSVKSAVRSVKWEVELQMWHVKQDTTFAECTHARAWLAHGACKFYRWERSYSISLRQLPPRLVRVLLV